MKKTAVLLVNLGSPNTLDVPAIKNFLRRFLSDRNVVNLPRLLWYPILYLFILPFRSKKLLSKYTSIWNFDDNSSPLVFYTKTQASQLQQLLAPEKIVVDYAFCYSNPDIQDALSRLDKLNIEHLIVLPLYPQFSTTTTIPVFELVNRFYCNRRHKPSIKFIRNFQQSGKYIEAVSDMILANFRNNGIPQKLIFSYHSLPQKIIDNGDSYYDECIETTKQIVKRLSLSESQYVIGFQSKFGSQKWLSPATINVIRDVALDGIKHIAVVCPGFISDCLETLEEINILNREIFIKNGGQVYEYIECLNAREVAINCLAEIVEINLLDNIK